MELLFSPEPGLLFHGSQASLLGIDIPALQRWYAHAHYVQLDLHVVVFELLKFSRRLLPTFLGGHSFLHALCASN